MSEAPWQPFTPDSVNVDIEDLVGFADRMSEDANHFLLSQVAGIDEHFADRPSFSGGGLKEGMSFEWAYDHVLSAVGQLLAHAEWGLRILGGGAGVIATEYRTGDELSAATVETVHRTFHPTTLPGEAHHE